MGVFPIKPNSNIALFIIYQTDVESKSIFDNNLTYFESNLYSIFLARKSFQSNKKEKNSGHLKKYCTKVLLTNNFSEPGLSKTHIIMSIF